MVIGSTDVDESEGFDRQTLSLGQETDDLITAVAAVNPRTVVVLNVGAPIAMPWLDKVGAVLLAHFPGQEGGHAIAEILRGTAEPGGWLPTSWLRSDTSATPSVTPADGVLQYIEGDRFGYRASGGDHAFTFGDGLGYTTWARGAASGRLEADGSLAIRGEVRNTGGRRGTQPLMVFVSSTADPTVRYAGSTLVDLESGGASTEEIRVPARRLARLLPGVAPSNLRFRVSFSYREARGQQAGLALAQ